MAVDQVGENISRQKCEMMMRKKQNNNLSNNVLGADDFAFATASLS